MSDDGNLLAYSTDTTGFRQYALHVKALVTRRAYADTAERVTSVEWASDNQTLFYVTEDKVTKRPNQLWRMKLGSAPVLVYEEKDELFDIGVGRTKDKRYLVLAVNSTDTWENRYLDAATPDSPFKVVLPREKGHKYLGRSPRRPLLHPDEQGREELPHGDGTGRRSVAGQLEGVHPAPPGRADRGPGAVQGLSPSPWSSRRA